ncbi:hypothetical protein A2714_04870 [Candidatus Woesebacteria bacterium RIFCSPHIGHO2_01_FULL_38_9]|uniref:Uncharacterized protein n=1 Tax=Candidatus Woesebacteria bacterium RIFCSPHIGHO2_01_FULL_38_9 TaxID=1802492 RepID=A0A1F7Y1E7_9BACT|nr:MAG: hypothetical protein A2714_04870 [Candidatus Woesebacteria bacterium RIFCSPHIGHO2_01_FULL_38_9]
MSLLQESRKPDFEIKTESDVQRDLGNAISKAETLLVKFLDEGDPNLFDAGNQILGWVATGEPVSAKTVQTAFKRGLISGLDRDKLLREIEKRSDHPDLDQVISDN